jgi:hypothetical protein
MTVAPDEARVDERAERVEVGVTEGLGRLDGEAAGERRQPGEQPALLVAQQS